MNTYTETLKTLIPAVESVKHRELRGEPVNARVLELVKDNPINKVLAKFLRECEEIEIEPIVPMLVHGHFMNVKVTKVICLGVDFYDYEFHGLDEYECDEEYLVLDDDPDEDLVWQDEDEDEYFLNDEDYMI